METTVAPPARFIERRRPYAVAPQGLDFVERRRTAPVLLRDVDDLHGDDLDGLLADQMAYGFTAAQAADAAAMLAELIGATSPAALVAHDLRPGASAVAA
jgi:hypothetical protein